jgi:hypothetical protein
MTFPDRVIPLPDNPMTFPDRVLPLPDKTKKSGKYYVSRSTK